MSAEPWAIRSKPEYTALEHDPLSRWNLLIGEGDGLIGLINLLRATPTIKPATTTVLYTGSDVEKAYVQAYFTADKCAKVSRFEDTDALLTGLPEVLEQQYMGTRVYVCGAEAFLWKVQDVTKALGMHQSEVAIELCGSQARRVYCPHCETLNEGVTTDISECSGCGLSLVNVDHFSRNLGAYFGYRVDAEAPGEVPERKELYR